MDNLIPCHKGWQAVVGLDTEHGIRLYVVPVIGYLPTQRETGDTWRRVAVRPVVMRPNGYPISLAGKTKKLVRRDEDVSAAKIQVEGIVLRRRARALDKANKEHDAALEEAEAYEDEFYS